VVNRRPLGRRLAIKFAKVMRWLHIYLSMFGLAMVFFFSATGVTLNHPDWFFGETQRSVQAEGQVDRNWLRAPAAASSSDESEDPATLVSKLEIVEHLRAAHGIRGALADFKVIDRDSGHYSLTQSFHGPIAILNDLHKGRDTGFAWSIFIDVSAILLILISLSGLVLLFYLKLRRGPGLVVVAVGTVVVIALFYWGVP
jgi:hypothetical protein